MGSSPSVPLKKETSEYSTSAGIEVLNRLAEDVQHLEETVNNAKRLQEFIETSRVQRTDDDKVVDTVGRRRDTEDALITDKVETTQIVVRAYCGKLENSLDVTTRKLHQLLKAVTERCAGKSPNVKENIRSQILLLDEMLLESKTRLASMKKNNAINEVIRDIEETIKDFEIAKSELLADQPGPSGHDDDVTDAVPNEDKEDWRTMALSMKRTNETLNEENIQMQTELQEKEAEILNLKDKLSGRSVDPDADRKIQEANEYIQKIEEQILEERLTHEVEVNELKAIIEQLETRLRQEENEKKKISTQEESFREQRERKDIFSDLNSSTFGMWKESFSASNKSTDKNHEVKKKKRGINEAQTSTTGEETFSVAIQTGNLASSPIKKVPTDDKHTQGSTAKRSVSVESQTEKQSIGLKNKHKGRVKANIKQTVTKNRTTDKQVFEEKTAEAVKGEERRVSRSSNHSKDSGSSVSIRSGTVSPVPIAKGKTGISKTKTSDKDKKETKRSISVESQTDNYCLVPSHKNKGQAVTDVESEPTKSPVADDITFDDTATQTDKEQEFYVSRRRSSNYSRHTDSTVSPKSQSPQRTPSPDRSTKDNKTLSYASSFSSEVTSDIEGKEIVGDGDQVEDCVQANYILERGNLQDNNEAKQTVTNVSSTKEDQEFRTEKEVKRKKSPLSGEDAKSSVILQTHDQKSSSKATQMNDENKHENIAVTKREKSLEKDTQNITAGDKVQVIARANTDAEDGEIEDKRAPDHSEEASGKKGTNSNDIKTPEKETKEPEKDDDTLLNEQLFKESNKGGDVQLHVCKGGTTKEIVYRRNDSEIVGNLSYHNGFGAVLRTNVAALNVDSIQCDIEDALENEMLPDFVEGERVISFQLRLLKKYGTYLNIQEGEWVKLFLPHRPTNNCEEVSLICSHDDGDWEPCDVIRERPESILGDVQVVGAKLRFVDDVKIVAIARERMDTVMAVEADVNYTSNVDRTVKVNIGKNVFKKRTEVKIQVHHKHRLELSAAVETHAECQQIMACTAFVSVVCEDRTVRDMSVQLELQEESEECRYVLFLLEDSGWKLADCDWQGKQLTVHLRAGSKKYRVLGLELPTDMTVEEKLLAVKTIHEHAFHFLVRLVVRQREDDPSLAVVVCMRSKLIKKAISELRAKGFSIGNYPSSQFCLQDRDVLTLGVSGNLVATPLQSQTPDLTFNSQKEMIIKVLRLHPVPVDHNALRSTADDTSGSLSASLSVKSPRKLTGCVFTDTLVVPTMKPEGARKTTMS